MHRARSVLVVTFASASLGGIVAPVALVSSVTERLPVIIAPLACVAVAGSTLATAALFRPLVRRVRSAVVRRFDRARYDAAQTVETFAQRLRAEIDLDALSAEVVATASRTMQPQTSHPWLVAPEMDR